LASSNRIGRRSVLKLGTAVLATPVLGAAASAGVAAAAGSEAPAAQPAATGTRVFAAKLVPDGAVCRLALVADHHYWPEHKENWGGGAQITSLSDRRMPDLAATLNALKPDLSIHAGDVISAAGSFHPTADAYTKQLEFQARFMKSLTHPCIATIGNHETLEAHYASHAQLAAWSKHFGAPFREHDVKGWRFLTLNPMVPNAGQRHGAGDGFGNVYGLDDEQLQWLRGRLTDAAGKKLHVVVVVHVPPSDWFNNAAFEEVLTGAGAGTVKAVLCGHWHRNNSFFIGGIPVLVRTSNVETPFGYHMVHCYADGRLIVVQHSQHFPYEEFLSAGFAQGKQGAEADRYVTIGGGSQLPLTGLRVIGADARARIVDGHLRLLSRTGRATLLIDTAALGDARLSLTAVKARGERMGGIARAAADGTGGIEAVVTSRYSDDGKVYLAAGSGAARQVLARDWFNIGDDIAYRLTLECRKGKITATWANMLTLEASVSTAAAGGHYGCFVERGGMFVTDVTLDALTV
jgi:hypothetical protein